jgi:hypothetical protein
VKTAAHTGCAPWYTRGLMRYRSVAAFTHHTAKLSPDFTLHLDMCATKNHFLIALVSKKSGQCVARCRFRGLLICDSCLYENTVTYSRGGHAGRCQCQAGGE